jgi:hypothetical protein
MMMVIIRSIVGSSQCSEPNSLVMPGLDPGIHHASQKVDCRVKPGNDNDGLRVLLRAHQIGEPLEQVMRVARAG